MKRAAFIFKLLAIILSYAMCIVVSYLYGVQLCASVHHLTSAPAWVAFLFAIPFSVAILICVAVYLILRAKIKKNLAR